MRKMKNKNQRGKWGHGGLMYLLMSLIINSRAVPEIMTNRVIVGNLGISTNEEDIKSAFTECGKIDSVKLHVDPATGRSKGYAIVVYKHTYEARYAIKKLNGSEIKGKQVWRTLDMQSLSDNFDMCRLKCDHLMIQKTPFLEIMLILTIQTFKVSL